MKLTILKDEPKKGKILKRIDLNQHVQTISEVSKEICEALIRDNKGNHYIEQILKGVESLNGKCYINYPIKDVVEFEIKNCETIGSLLWQISQAYVKIYKEEEKTMTVNSSPKGMLLNRSDTNGKYGIWGHDLGDLWFELIEFDNNGNIFLHIGS